MSLEHIQPDGLARPTGYTHVVRARGGSTVYVSGQISADADGKVVGEGDFAAQARQVFANLRAALASVGAGFEHVAKMTTYIVNYTPELRPALVAARSEVMGDVAPASTLIGVQALAAPAYLIEVEVIAVLDD
ncbi:MAG: RidA family protein [Chloroflexi bacterium]|nr:RidA family protein [Chloroflexota bacterium]MDA1003716.1 RidA family protein [Chloroflexota bacterium]